MKYLNLSLTQIALRFTFRLLFTSNAICLMPCHGHDIWRGRLSKQELRIYRINTYKVKKMFLCPRGA